MNINQLVRPENFNEYIGQKNIIANLKTYIASAKKRKVTLDHIIIHGQSGMGKTSLASLIAKEINKRIIILNGPSLQKPSDIISPLTTLKEMEFLFIDEVHAVSKEVLEVLYPVLETNELSVIIGKDYNSKIINIKLKPFTLICATTEINKLPLPFVNRFPINFHLQPYNNDEISTIIFNFSEKINLLLSYEYSSFLATYAKNNPRLATNIMKRINDYIVTENPQSINIYYLKNILHKLEIFKFGLNSTDIRYLKILNTQKYLGIESVSQILDLPISIITSTIEPTLIKKKLIEKGVRGRTLTKDGASLLEELMSNGSI